MQTPRTAAPAVGTQPAIMKPTEEPPAYSQPQKKAAHEQPQGAAELLRRQEELEKKAAELDRREREMQTLSASGGEPPVVSGNQSLRGGVGGCGVPIGQLQSASLIPPPRLLSGRKNNWPPLPERFPVSPCFYHDITVDIPVEYQKTVQIMFYLWMCEWLLQWGGEAQRGVDNLGEGGRSTDASEQRCQSSCFFFFCEGMKGFVWHSGTT